MALLQSPRPLKGPQGSHGLVTLLRATLAPGGGDLKATWPPETNVGLTATQGLYRYSFLLTKQHNLPIVSIRNEYTLGTGLGWKEQKRSLSSAVATYQILITAWLDLSQKHLAECGNVLSICETNEPGNTHR